MDEKTKERLLTQDSFCYHALIQARKISKNLMDERVPFEPFPIDKEGYSDDALREHQQRFLRKWSTDKLFVQKFRRFSLPLFHPYAEEIIRWTLGLSTDTKIQDFHVKQAALTACLTPLRQSIGSCFATAPAIEIQQFHLDLFVDDLYELLSRGRLTRVVEGREYSAPFCFTVTEKNSVYNALLKVWEFTLASYCDIKMEFSKWNIGWCIGLSPDEKDGIGEMLVKALQEQLLKDQAHLQKMYEESVIAHDQLKALERLSYNATSEQEVRRIRAEAIAKAHHLQVCHDLYKESQENEKSTAHFLQFLFKEYTTLFQSYFQEIYDPAFTDDVSSVYEDRRAGFRLIYKHGRVDISTWTAIQDEKQFISSLDDFFRAAEPQLAHLCQTPHEKNLVTKLTTQILQHIHTNEFLHSTLSRAKKRGRLPWAYSSGGSVDQIASIYFRKTAPLQSEERVIQDELDLFIFILDTMKGLPPSQTHRFAEDKQRGLLFQPPTHVCLLLPGMPNFYEAWNDKSFTYTWIRDQWVEPARSFYLKITFSKEEQKELYKRLGVTATIKQTMTIEEFAKELKHLPIDLLGSFLFETLPLVPAEQCQALLQEPTHKPFLSSRELFQALYKESADVTRAQMREMGLASQSFLFADTNWSNGYFSFVIHPVTLKLEIWKTDRAGLQGSPISLVKSWLGKEPWTIFINSY